MASTSAASAARRACAVSRCDAQQNHACLPLDVRGTFFRHSGSRHGTPTKRLLPRHRSIHGSRSARTLLAPSAVIRRNLRAPMGPPTRCVPRNGQIFRQYRRLADRNYLSNSRPIVVKSSEECADIEVDAILRPPYASARREAHWLCASENAQSPRDCSQQSAGSTSGLPFSTGLVARDRRRPLGHHCVCPRRHFPADG